MSKKRSEQGQSTLELAILIAAVLAAFVFMNIYMKRSVEGKLRSNTDQIGGQFDPVSADSNFVEVQNALTNETTTGSGRVDTNLYSVTGNRSGTETVSGDLVGKNMWE